MEREGAKKNVSTFIHVRVFSCDYECNATRVIISRRVNDNQHFRILLSIRTIYLEYMKYQDSRKRKICDFEFSSAENKRSIFRYSRSVPREERNFLHSYASYTLSKRNEITGAPTHSPGHFDAARNAFGVRVCARV